MTRPGIIHRITLKIFLITFSFIIIGLTGSLSTWLYLRHMVKGEIITTPNLYGKSIEAIQDDLDRLGLVLQVDLKKVPSNVVAVDHIVYQTPAPGKKIKKNRRVEVSLSSGVVIKRVPDLKNQSIYFANMMTEKLETRISRASRIPSSTYKKGRVISQTPKKGVEVPTRTGISVLLSDGPPQKWYIMPNVRGLSLSRSKEFFEESGFRVVTKYKYNDKLLPDEIIWQLPQPGYPVRKKSTVTLEVNRIK